MGDPAHSLEENEAILVYLEALEHLQLPFDTARFLPKWVSSQPTWQVLYGLLNSPIFVVEEPLRSRIDVGSSPAHEMYKLLWEARFAFREKQGPRAKALVDLFLRWTLTLDVNEADQQALTDLGLHCRFKVEDRYIVLHFLLSLAKDNGIL
jgi:hypothetical protein